MNIVLLTDDGVVLLKCQKEAAAGTCGFLSLLVTPCKICYNVLNWFKSPAKENNKGMEETP